MTYEKPLGRTFLVGWLLMCAAAFGLPLLVTQLEMARSITGTGVVGFYSRGSGDVTEIVRFEKSPSIGASRPPLLSWHRVIWRGKIWIERSDDYRFALATKKADVLILEIAGSSDTARSQQKNSPLRVEVGPLRLERGWHEFSARRAVANKARLDFLMGQGIGPLEPIPSDRFQARPEDAAEFQACQRRRGGLVWVGRLLACMYFQPLKAAS